MNKSRVKTYVLSQRALTSLDRDGVVVRALASQQRGPGSNPGVDVYVG